MDLVRIRDTVFSRLVNYSIELAMTDEVRKFHDELFRSAPECRKIEKSKLVLLEEPVLESYVTPKFGLVLKTKAMIPINSLITPVFGTLRMPEKDQVIGDQMIVTKSGMIIDGTEAASLWKFMKMSCVANCRLVEWWEVDEEGRGELAVYVQTIRDIECNENVTLDPKDMRNDMNFKFDCKCAEAGCRVLRFACKDTNCKRFGIPYNDLSGLHKHETVHHGRTTRAEDKIYKCTRKVGKNEICNKKLKGMTSYKRHLKNCGLSMEKRKKHICRHCKAGYVTQYGLEQHFKRGCKVLYEKWKEGGCESRKNRQSSLPADFTTLSMVAESGSSNDDDDSDSDESFVPETPKKNAKRNQKNKSCAPKTTKGKLEKPSKALEAEGKAKRNQKTLAPGTSTKTEALDQEESNISSDSDSSSPLTRKKNNEKMFWSIFLPTKKFKMSKGKK